MVAPVPPSADIIRLYGSGELARELARYHKPPGDQEDPFVDACVALHNAGEMDLVAVPSQPTFAEIRGHAFFVAQQFYCDAVPQLSTGATALMDCCRKLIEQAGEDGAAGRPNEAFRLWCQNNPDKLPRLCAKHARETNWQDGSRERLCKPAAMLSWQSRSSSHTAMIGDSRA